jgi:putative two-component system response regulator
LAPGIHPLREVVFMAPQAPLAEPHCETILVVDDDPTGLLLTGQTLQRHGYRVVAADSGAAAVDCATGSSAPDLVLLDIEMPAMSGFEVLRLLRAAPNTADIPVILLTGIDDQVSEARGLALGAVDFIAKSVQPCALLAHVRARLEAARVLAALRGRNARLEDTAARRLGANARAQAVVVNLLTSLVKTRDHETGSHLLRTQAYVGLLANELQADPRHAPLLTDHYIALLARAAPLHDIGKVGIPDRILNNPGKFDADELAIMRTHCVLGAQTIEQAARPGEDDAEFFEIAQQMARWHHERWDGGGYPDGLRGDAIPLSARIMAVADVFDALVSRRPYKEPMSCEQARELICGERGRHFDADVVGAFERQFDVMSRIAGGHNAGVPPRSTPRNGTTG